MEGLHVESEHTTLLHEKPSQQEKNPLVPSGWRGYLFYIRLASFWFAYSGMMGALPSVVWPSQIEALVGVEKKEEYNGYIPAFGAFVSLIITPIAGVLSDRSTSRLGRRKLFIITGMAIATGFLLLLGFYGKEGDNLWLFVVFTVGLQFGANWAAGPYAGLLPDVTHPSQRGTASGFNGLGQVFGYLVGLAAAGVLTQHNSYWRVYMCLTLIFVVFSMPTIFGIRENPRLAESTKPMTMRAFFRSFYLDPKIYRSFYWVIATRGMEQMGYYSVMPFFQFFLEDVLKVHDAEQWSSILFVVILIASVPSSLIAGRLSDKYGRKLLVYLSTGLMAAMMGGMICVALVITHIYALAVFGAFFGVGYGAFLAVDWALALDALPPDADTAKDMGIWHVAFVFPQVVAPIVTGVLLTNLKIYSITIAYASVFAVSCGWFVLSAIFVSKVQVAVKKPTRAL